MTEKEIIEQAIKKALDNGWIAPFSLREAFDSWWEDNKSFHDYYKLIFDLQFAKAFWGSNTTNKYGTDVSYIGTDADPLKELAIAAGNKNYTGGVDPNGIDLLEAWQFHLKRMVISDSPIKYMEQYL